MGSAELDAAIRSLVTLSATAGGVFVVVRLALHYQADFTDRYASRVDHLENRLDAADAELAGCERRTDRLVAAMRTAGIDIPPDVWDPPR